MESYANLYKDQWLQTEPSGTSMGALTNYTQDLFFSMERLSSNAYTVKRLNPASDKLPFIVDDSIVQKLSGQTLSALFKAGRLFVGDHSTQLPFASDMIPGRSQAYTVGYFYIHPTKNQFLPLAIKTYTGANLTYTPLDQPQDWLLAKIMYNNNDFFHGQVYHLAGTHDVAEIVYLAALRTLSPAHPVAAYLKRSKFLHLSTLFWCCFERTN